ncbi:MAG TPA: glutathionylspermidine synthase family protein [Bacteroidota bacterium]|nr:glutathionylspermidine synthase family protein [Bacteroidota bacterium]
MINRTPVKEPEAVGGAYYTGASNEDLRAWLLQRSIPSLPYTAGEPRLRALPCFIPSRRLKALRTAAVAVCRAYDELCEIIVRNPSHIDEFFALTPMEKMLWFASGGFWHGIARADVFCTTDGAMAVAEVNSDTPSGADEACLLGRYAESRYPGFVDPNRNFREAFLRVMMSALTDIHRAVPSPTVGIVYPTDIPEDQGMIALYRTWLESAGFRVVLGAPANLGKSPREYTTLFGTEIDILFRHYKTDWWCERANVWKDARQIPDDAPLLREAQNVVGPMTDGMLAVVNPFGTVITQSKLSLAFFHERMELFSSRSQQAIRRYVPVTRRLSSFGAGELEREKADWVLKSDYGCEGAEVVIGRHVSAEAWANALRLAIPHHWVAQRYFEPEQEEGGMTANYGLYIAGGEPAGMYVRLSAGATGSTAVVAPALERLPLDGAGRRPAGDIPEEIPSCGSLVSELLDAYTPAGRWLPHRMSLLLRSADDPALVEPIEYTAAAETARAAGSALASLLAHAENGSAQPLLVICDLDGVESIAFASEAAAATEIVLQMENIAHELETVPLRTTLGALVRFAPRIRELGKGRPAGTPATIVLDRKRLSPPADEAGQFNNRHWGYLPGTGFLEALGIRRILLINPDGDPKESDDLNEDLALYQDAGLKISFASPSAILVLRERTVEELLLATVRDVRRRETVFSYMLPPAGDRGVIAHQNEGAAR